MNMPDKNDPNAPWPHSTDCMCRKCCLPQRLPTAEELEGILREETDTARRATAYGALTLTRVLAKDWTHLVPKKSGGQETIVLPRGEICGEWNDLEHRLERLAWELR